MLINDPRIPPLLTWELREDDRCGATQIMQLSERNRTQGWRSALSKTDRRTCARRQHQTVPAYRNHFDGRLAEYRAIIADVERSGRTPALCFNVETSRLLLSCRSWSLRRWKNMSLVSQRFGMTSSTLLFRAIKGCRPGLGQIVCASSGQPCRHRDGSHNAQTAGTFRFQPRTNLGSVRGKRHLKSVQRSAIIRLPARSPPPIIATAYATDPKLESTIRLICGNISG